MAITEYGSNEVVRTVVVEVQAAMQEGPVPSVDFFSLSHQRFVTLLGRSAVGPSVEVGPHVCLE